MDFLANPVRGIPRIPSPLGPGLGWPQEEGVWTWEAERKQALLCSEGGAGQADNFLLEVKRSGKTLPHERWLALEERERPVLWQEGAMEKG